MSVANQTHDHQENCLVPLISLRMLAQGDAGTPLPRWVVIEVAQATSTVLAEAEAEAAGRRPRHTERGRRPERPSGGLDIPPSPAGPAGDRSRRCDHRGTGGRYRRDASASAQVRRADLGHLDRARCRVWLAPGQRRVVNLCPKVAGPWHQGPATLSDAVVGRWHGNDGKDP